MRVRVKVASTPGEIRSLLETRHQVFVEEDRYLPPQGGTIVDLYDALPSTENLIAVADGEVCGGVRVTVDNEAGMPADAFFDFRRLLPADARLASCSMLCLKRSTRGVGRLLVGMLRMCVYWSCARRLTHLCAPVNPKVAPLLRRIGLVPVGEEFVDPKGLPTLPMVLDLSNLSRDFADFVRRQDVGLWMDSFERAFFSAGDVIVRGGERGTEAYLLVDGAAEALEPGAEPGGPVVQRFAPGQVFGELALLTERPRSTTVVASEAADVMVLNREQFERQIVSNPDLTLALMRSLGERFHDAVVNQRRGAPGNS